MDLESIYDTLLSDATGREIHDLIEARHEARRYQEEKE